MTKIRVNDKFYPVLSSEHRYLIMRGGAGSSKSFTAAQKILLRCLESNKHRFLVCRKVANTIEGSVYKLFCDLIDLYGLQSITSKNKSVHSIRFANGNEIITSGLDDSEKLKSIAGITGIWIEEATELEDSDFKQLDLRLRGETDSYKQIILTFNPIDERHWLKNVFFDNKPDNCFLHHSTYKDNYFIDSEYEKMLNDQIVGDDNLRRIYIDGEWGRIVIGTEFYHKFNFYKNVSDIAFIPQASIHLSFDFNVIPYCTMLCFQLLKIKNDRWQIRCFDEFCLQSPYNDPQGLCKKFIEKYEDDLKGCQLYIYGDATGRATSTTGQKDGFVRKNNFDLIKDELFKYLDNASMRVPSYNPALKARKQKMNRVLSGEWLFDFVVDRSCKNTIADLENVQEDSDGTKLKRKKMDKHTGRSFEEYGHCSDCVDYLTLEAFKAYMK